MEKEDKRLGFSSFLNACTLTSVPDLYILICMRTTLNIDDALLERACQLTGVKEKTALVRMGLDALVARESAARLAALGGTEKQLKPIPRRRHP
jgi:Arc/MetJ family transcription regulator